MVITFSDDEKRYLITSKGKWAIKEDCPPDIRKSLEKKLYAMSDEARDKRLKKVKL